MFLRWKKYEPDKDGWVYWRLCVVESSRVNGKPRQKVLKYLGSVSRWGLHTWKEEDRQFRCVEPMVEFWRKVFVGLRELKLTQTQRRKFLDKIKEKVPPITRELLAKWEPLDLTNINGKRYNPKEEWEALAKRLPRGRI